MKFAPVLSVLVLTAIAPVAGAAEITVPASIPYAEGLDVREAIRKECNLEAELSKGLVEYGGGRIAIGDAKGAKGKVFEGKITGVWAAPGPWGAASILVEGELKERGKVIGTVASRRNTTRGGGACGKIAVSTRAVAKDIAEWTQSPAMDSKLGDAAKK